MAVNVQNTNSYCVAILDWSDLYLYRVSYERMCQGVCRLNVSMCLVGVRHKYPCIEHNIPVSHAYHNVIP